MGQIYLCFLWHMHQPFYKDLVSGEYKLPWTRLHALKDYYGMVRLLEDFPAVHQTFNLVPSMLMQLEEYASGAAIDPFLHCALKPAESLTPVEQDFILRHFFQAYPHRMIYRYPRYGELFEAWQAQRSVDPSRRLFTAQDFRDLQVLSQIAWFDEEFLEQDAEVRDLIAKGQDFNLEDQALMGKKQREILTLVLPEYKRLAASGQIEISTTPFYHPILPLICDSNIAAVSHPGVTLPSRFRYPNDARLQIERARDFMTLLTGVTPAGLWPSEGSVSDEVFTLAADAGFRWTATDNGVLDRTLGRHTGIDGIYRPYEWRQGNRRLRVIFRDHFLSDLIGFTYSRMNAQDAASDFLHRIRENCRYVRSGRDALAPIILDGENAWEYYEHNGRPFLSELYRQISEDPDMSAVTVAEALEKIESEPLDHMFPGSWINANFDVWIGAEEDNLAWEYLLRARETFDAAMGASEEQKRMAYEELLIAEGSDWNWWYGPEHESANREEFDQLYRAHLANVYRALGKMAPEELGRPILRLKLREFHLDPTGPVSPVIDGEVTSYFEWIGAGIYRVDPRSGAMHGKRLLTREAYYGSNDRSFFLRLDFHSLTDELVGQLEVRINLRAAVSPDYRSLVIRLSETVGELHDTIVWAFKSVFELQVPLAWIGPEPKEPVQFQISIWQGGLPVEALPQQGWLVSPGAEAREWGG